jgi:hypothetical protein
MSFLFQRVPEAVLERRADLEEALTFHGLTRARMTAEVIRWVESVRLENPETYRYFVKDPVPMAPLILKWDFVFSTGMTTDYPKRRNWTHWMGLREFIQNALDVEERVYGYEKIAINIFQDRLGVHVVDRGPGITLEAFKLGGSDKGCEERGYFGEGLKVAAAHFAGSDVLVYVFNRQGQVFKMCLSPGTNLVVVVMGRAKYPPVGTEVVLMGATLASELLVSTVFQEWVKVHPEVQVISKRVFGTSGCDVPKPNIIVKGANNVDILWVRDIFVNTLTNITRKPAIFGYNLWWVPLEPNRVMVADQSALASQAAKTFNADTAKILLDKIVEEKNGYAEVKRGFFETDVVDWWYTPVDVEDAVKEWVEARGLGVTTNERAVDWIAYMGVKPLIITEQLSNLFTKAPEAEGKVLEKSLEKLKLADATAIPEEALSLRELKYLGASVGILTWVQRGAIWGKKLPDVVVAESLAEASGLQRGDKLYVTRSSLNRLDVAFSTLYHEYCHYYGDWMYGQARDLSDAFQRALTEVSGLVAEALKEVKVFNTYRRALNGGWKANSCVWHESHYVTKTMLLDQILEDVAIRAKVPTAIVPDWEPLYTLIESSAPICVAVSISPGASQIFPREVSVSREVVTMVMPEELPPSRDLYQKEVWRVADTMAVDRGIIYMYNPWIDKYEVLRPIGI